jgi:hypothetical protein
VPPPQISGFTPASARIGAQVTITGSALTGATAVAFHGTVAAYTVVSDAEITATVPAGATNGAISVTTPAGTATSAASFTVLATPKPKPAVFKLRPTAGKRRAIITISGARFGSKRGRSYVKFGSVKCTKYLSWGKSRIKCRVPTRARYGKVKVRVTTSAGRSAGRTFRVKR